MVAASARLIVLVGLCPFGWTLYSLPALAHQTAAPTVCHPNLPLQAGTSRGALVLQGMAALPRAPAVQELLLLVLVLLAAVPAPGQALTDAQLLLQLMASFTNGASILSSWQGDNPCVGWYRVTCTNDQVTQM